MKNTIKKHKDFYMDDELPGVKMVRTSLFIAKSRPTIFDSGRFGLIVTKRNWKHATDRNRIKRMLRVWIRLNTDKMDAGRDYIFIAGRNMLDADFERGMKTIARALSDLNADNK